MKTLSIRQPWAWLIVAGYKTVENRTRYLGFTHKPFLVHASSRMTRADYDACVLFLRSSESLRHIVDVLPDQDGMSLGGIVGMATIKSVVGRSSIYAPDAGSDPWYTGEVGYLLEDAKPLPFKACKGRLGFFDVDYEALPL